MRYFLLLYWLSFFVTGLDNYTRFTVMIFSGILAFLGLYSGQICEDNSKPLLTFFLAPLIGLSVIYGIFLGNYANLNISIVDSSCRSLYVQFVNGLHFILLFLHMLFFKSIFNKNLSLVTWRLLRTYFDKAFLYGLIPSYAFSIIINEFKSIDQPKSFHPMLIVFFPFFASYVFFIICSSFVLYKGLANLNEWRRA